MPCQSIFGEPQSEAQEDAVIEREGAIVANDGNNDPEANSPVADALADLDIRLLCGTYQTSPYYEI